MVFGIRGDDRNFEVGEELPLSFDMQDELYDFETDSYPLLDGTCAIEIGNLWFFHDDDDIETVKTAIDKCKKYKYSNMYLIAGYDYEYGTDDAEIVIKCAEVVGKINVEDIHNE